jgi:hypothetical protein
MAMKTNLTLIIIMTMLVGIARGQNKKSKTKKPMLRDSVYAYQIIPRSGNALNSVMPIDTGRNGNVKMPNSYRKRGLEPVPMPTHKVEMLTLKRSQDSSGKGSTKRVPMPDDKVEPVKPKKK